MDSRKRHRSQQGQDPKESRDLTEPILKLLNTLITKEGEPSEKRDTPPAYKSRLRLATAQLLLKLCKATVYDELLTPDAFNRLVCVARDSIDQVRLGFVMKLKNISADRGYQYDSTPLFSSSL